MENRTVECCARYANLTFLGLTTLVFAGPVDQQLSAVRLNKPHLYKVSGGKRISYLFGTTHYGYSANQLPHWVLAIHDRTAVHAYETPDKNAQDAERILIAMRVARKNPELLAQRLAKENPATNSEVITSRLTLFGIPKSVAPYVEEKPGGGWNGCQTLVQNDLIFDRPFYSLDIELEVRSHKAGKKILTLDRPGLREEAGKLDGFEENDECNLQEWSVFDVLKFREKILEELAQYAAGDSEYPIPANLERSVAYRNHAWVDMLEEPLRKGSVFVAAGQGHLYGENGLIRLLEKRGYIVERMLRP